jgi:transposase
MTDALKILGDKTSEDLRLLARSEKNPSVVSRLYGIAHALDGLSRSEAARLVGINVQTLHDWIVRYNKEGVEGLQPRPRGHRKSTFSQEIQARLVSLVETGPTPELTTRVRWRREDLRDVLSKEFDVTYHERTIGKLLKKLDFVRLKARPTHPKRDLQKSEALKKTLPTV